MLAVVEVRKVTTTVPYGPVVLPLKQFVVDPGVEQLAKSRTLVNVSAEAAGAPRVREKRHRAIVIASAMPSRVMDEPPNVQFKSAVLIGTFDSKGFYICFQAVGSLLAGIPSD